MSPYEYVIKLRDMFSPQMLAVANNYGKAISGMEKQTNRVPSAINRLKSHFNFPKEIKSIKTLTSTLDTLERRRKVSVDTSEIKFLNREIDKAKNGIQRLSSLGAAKKSGGNAVGMGGMGWLMGGVAGGAIGYGVSQAVGSVWNNSVNPAMNRGADRFMLGLMLKDRAAGNDLTKQLAKFSADNAVLGSEEVFSSARKLISSGFKREEIIPELKMLGDLAAGSGTPLDALTYLYKQIKQNKIAQAQELSPMADYIPIYDAISTLKKKPIADIRKMGEKGQLTFEDVQAGLRSLTSGDGLFAGASEGLAGESIGKYRKLLGDLQEQAIKLGEALLPYVNKGMEFVGRMLENIKPLEEAFSMAGHAFMGLLRTYHNVGVEMGFFSKQTDTAKMYVDLLAGALKLVGYFFQGLSVIVRAVMRPVIIIVNEFRELMDGIGTAIDYVTDKFKKLVTLGGNGLGHLGNLFTLFTAGQFGAAAKYAMNLPDLAGDKSSAPPKAKNLAGALGKLKSNPGSLSSLAMGLPSDGAGKPAGSGPSSGSGSGLNATLENSKSRNITINVTKLIEKSEINVMSLDEGIDTIESKLIEALSRLLQSSGRLVGQ